MNYGIGMCCLTWIGSFLASLMRVCHELWDWYVLFSLVLCVLQK